MDSLPPSVQELAEQQTAAARKRLGIAESLVAMGLRYRLVHDDRKQAYLVVEHPEGGSRPLRIRSNECRHYLRAQFRRETGHLVNDQALTTALSVLETEALTSGELVRFGLRFLQTESEIWVDLGDARGRAVRITSEGWSVIDKPTVMFRRWNHMMPLPVPETGGDLCTIFRFLNVKRKEDKILLQCWMVTALLANIPRPLLLLHGTQGSGKSVAAAMIRSLLDPSASALLSLGRDEAELAQVLDHHAIPVFDNVTSLPGWISDLLCRAVTGGALSKRELYSDSDDVLLAFRCAPMMTGINIPVRAPDLLDRIWMIGLERLSPEQRKQEGGLWSDFDRARPLLFGAILDALVGAMRRYPTVGLNRTTRMADASVWGASVALSLGYSIEEYEQALWGNSDNQADALLEDDPFAQVVHDFVVRHGRWEGTATEFLDILNGERKGSCSTGWPSKADGVSRRLRTLAPLLACIGVEVSFRKTTNGRRVMQLIRHGGP